MQKGTITKLIIFLILASFECLGVNASSKEPPFLRISIEKEPVTLDWQGYRSVTDRLITGFIMRGLMTHGPTGKPICDLCESYTIHPKGKRLEFRLKRGIQWSDGVSLVAEHFVHGFTRLLNPDHGFFAAKLYSEIQSVRHQGKTTLIIELSKPSAQILDLLTLPPSYPVRKTFAAKAKQDQGEWMAREAVLGPYFLAEWDHGKRIVIEGNPKYKGERPVYRVEFIVGSHDELIEKFKSGKLDILRNPTTDEILKFKSAQVGVSPFWATRLLLLNDTQKPFHELAMRQAIKTLLDTQALPSLLKNGERIATGLIPPGVEGYEPLKPSRKTQQDVKKAQAIRHRLVPWAQEIKLDLLITSDQSERRIANWLQQELKKVKMNVEVTEVKNKTYFEKLENQSFQAAILTHGFQTSHPMDLLQLLARPTTIERLNESISPMVFSERLKKALDQLENQEVIVIPLGFPSQPYLLGRRVKTFEMTPFGEPDLLKIEVKN